MKTDFLHPKKHISSLKIIGALWLLLYAIPLSAQEICNNGIDDDGDGLIDCYDDECCQTQACENDSYDCLPTEILDCAQVFPVSIQKLWENNHLIDTRRTPVVGDIDNDGVTEVIVAGRLTQDLVIINGQTGSTEQILPFIGQSYFDAVAIADVNDNGFAEIFAVDNNRKLIRWEYNGNSFVKSTTQTSNQWSVDPTIGYPTSSGTNWTPSIADFNHDGVPEVYFGNQIWNAATGALVAQSTNGINSPFGISGNYVSGIFKKESSEAYTIAADILPDNFCTHCDGLELIAGPVVYSVNYASQQLNIEVDARGPANVEDGATSIADWNNDGELDVIVNGRTNYLYVYDGRTGNLFYPPKKITALENSQPSVGDVDKDGELELVAPGKNMVYALDNDFSVLWQRASKDGSSKTTASIFDLNGDFILELIYIDEAGLHIWDAATGETLESIGCTSGTRTNYPIVADVNGDGEANIICSCREEVPFPADKNLTGFVRAFKSKDFPWMPSREVMNQHSYSIININDDLTIPRFQQNAAKIPKLNQFLSQSTIYNGFVGYPLPDASISEIFYETECINDNETQANIGIVVCNTQGKAPLPLQTPISLYRANPSAGDLIKSIFTDVEIPAGGCDTVYTQFTYQNNTQLHLQINDAAITPDDQIDFANIECDSTNNVFNTTLNLVNTNFNINLVDDTILCSHEILRLEIASGFEYAWVDTGKTMSLDRLDSNVVFASPENNIEYHVTVTDDKNCTTHDSIFVQLDQTQLALQVNDLEACDSLRLDVDVTSTTGTFLWDFGDGTSSTQKTPNKTFYDPGAYVIKLEHFQNLEKCKKDTIFTVQIHEPQPYSKSNDTTICLGDEVELLIGGGQNHLWLDTAQTASLDRLDGPRVLAQPKNSIEYHFSLEDVNGCKSNDSIFVGVENPSLFIFLANDTACEQLSLEIINHSSNGNFFWDFGDGNTSNEKTPTHFYNTPGSYTLQFEHFISNEKCKVDTSLNITVHPAPSYQINPDTILCLGESLEVNLIGMHQVEWQNNKGITNPTGFNFELWPQEDILYSFLLTDTITGCTNTDSIAIEVDIAESNFDLQLLDSCETGTILLKNPSVGNYRIFYLGDGNEGFPIQQYNYMQEGTYEISYIVYNQLARCADTSSKTVTVYPNPEINIIPFDTICAGTTTILTATGGEKYEWFPEEKILGNNKESSIVVSPEMDETYSVYVSNEYGCTDSATSTVYVIQDYDVKIIRDTSIVIGEKLNFDLAPTIDLEILWQPSTYLNCTDCEFQEQLLVTEDICYEIKMIDPFKCFPKTQYPCVRVEYKFSIDVPTGFTPNNDGINDIIYVRGWGIKELLYFRIYNRWGEKVFESQDLDNGWDGNYKGSLQNDETYVYTVKALMYDNKIENLSGNLTLFK